MERIQTTRKFYDHSTVHGYCIVLYFMTLYNIHLHSITTEHLIDVNCLYVRMCFVFTFILWDGTLHSFDIDLILLYFILFYV